MAELKPVSYWSYSMFDKCPAQYKYVILDKIPVSQRIDNNWTILGALVHNSLELALKKDTPLWLNFSLALHQTLAEVSKRADPKKVEAQFKKAAAGMEWVVKNLKPFIDSGAKFHPEHTFKQINTDTGILLKGRVDLIIEEDTTCRIYDYKGVRKLESLTQEQMWFYGYGVKQEFKKELKEVAYLWFTQKEVRIFKPALVHDRMVEKLKDMQTKVINNQFPAKIGRYCTYCPAIEMCPAYKEMMNATDSAGL